MLKMEEYNECKYWFECKQDKRNLCTTNPEKCIIYLRFETLNKNKPNTKTGLERFIARYGKDWRLVAFGEQGNSNTKPEDTEFNVIKDYFGGSAVNIGNQNSRRKE